MVAVEVGALVASSAFLITALDSSMVSFARSFPALFRCSFHDLFRYGCATSGRPRSCQNKNKAFCENVHLSVSFLAPFDLCLAPMTGPKNGKNKVHPDGCSRFRSTLGGPAAIGARTALHPETGGHCLDALCRSACARGSDAAPSQGRGGWLAGPIVGRRMRAPLVPGGRIRASHLAALPASSARV